MDTQFWIVLVIILLSGIYFLPSIIARKDEQFKKIFFLNLLGAWTGILWFIALGWALFYSRPAKNKNERLERMILNFAKRNGGRLTAIELAAETDLSFEQAQIELNRFCEIGAAEVKLSENGEVVYAFLGFLSSDDKLNLQSPL